jgi:hypothetical protein
VNYLYDTNKDKNKLNLNRVHCKNKSNIIIVFNTFALNNTKFKIKMAEIAAGTSSNRTRPCIQQVKLIVSGILLRIWNNGSTIHNAKALFEQGHTWGSALTIFFLFFPGLVTSIGFLVLQCTGYGGIKKVPFKKVILYFLVLLFLYPIVPIGL